MKDFFNPVLQKLIQSFLIFLLFHPNKALSQINITPSYNQEVRICSQIWMAENLNVSRFQNGDSIQEVRTAKEWILAGTQKKPAWRYYDNDPENGKIYGRLYNWYAIEDPRGLAPKGWHVATDSEWKTIIDSLGGETIAGTKLKSEKGWNYQGNGSNSSKLSALPGGACSPSETYPYANIGDFGFFWTGSEKDSTQAWYLVLSTVGENVYRTCATKSDGMSVRCVHQ